MSKDLLQKEVIELRKTLFNMLNFTNMYILVLDESMIIKFANNSLAVDLGFDEYQRLLGRCWLDFIKEKDINMIKAIHNHIAYGLEGWEQYKEFRNIIKGINGKDIIIEWFNSHINTDYNWTFSFGINKKNLTITEKDSIENIRNYYHKMINKDRIMISSMRNIMKDKFVNNMNSCKPNFVENVNEESLSF